MWTNTLGDLTPLAEHNTTLAFVSRAPIDQIETARKQHGWTIPWYSLDDESFNEAVGYADIAQISVFTHQADDVYLTYMTNTGRDLETITSHWSLLARTPAGPLARARPLGARSPPKLAKPDPGSREAVLPRNFGPVQRAASWCADVETIAHVRAREDARYSRARLH